MSVTVQRMPEPPILPLDQRPDCPGPELMAAYIDGRRLWWGGRRRLEKHFADCDRCFTLLRDIMDFRDSDAGQEVSAEAPEDASPWRFAALPAGRRAPRLAWLGAGGFATVAAALLVVFVLRGPAGPELDPLIEALGTQRVTDARLEGFRYGPRPEVLRSSEPSASTPAISLEARGAAVRIQEEAATSTSAAAHHVVGVSRLISGDLDTAITDLQSAATAEPANATYLSDLAAAFLTRGIRQQKQNDLDEALKRADEALAKEPRHAEALFNRALALESLGQKEAARAAWEAYLQVDGTSAWAGEARQHLAGAR
jgi:cellulose synthase operon protein C